MKQVLISIALILLISVSATAAKNADTEKSQDSATKQIDSIPGKKDPVIEIADSKPKQKTEKASNLPISNSSGGTDDLYLVFGGLFLIFLLCFIILLKMNKLVKEDKMNEQSYNFEEKVKKWVSEVTTKIYRLTEEQTSIKKDIEQIKAFLIDNKGAELLPSEKSSASPSQNIQTQSPPSIPKEIFYFGPVADGFFENRYATKTFEENLSLYCFEMNPGSTQALFYVVENKPDVLLVFLNNPEAQNSACEGKYNPKAKRLENIKGEEGLAVLEGDKWRVKKKVQVRYIVE